MMWTKLIYLTLFSLVLRILPACAQASASEMGLFDAAAKGDMKIVKTSLASGADVNGRDEAGRTPLMIAAREDHLLVVIALIEAKANVNAKDSFGNTALIYASNRSLLDEIQVLIKAGADINAKDNTGNTALIDAAARGQLEAVQSLLAHGADLKISNLDGQTALDEANARGFNDLSALLARYGIGPAQPNLAGDVPPKFPSQVGEWEVTNKEPKTGKTVTHFVCLKDDTWLHALADIWVEKRDCSSEYDGFLPGGLISHQTCQRLLREFNRSTLKNALNGEQHRAEISVHFHGMTDITRDVSVEDDVVEWDVVTSSHKYDWHDDLHWTSQTCTSKDVKIK